MVPGRFDTPDTNCVKPNQAYAKPVIRAQSAIGEYCQNNGGTKIVEQTVRMRKRNWDLFI